MDEVQKLLSLITYLKKNPRTSYEKLAELLGESESQIRKDIQKLLMCGVPPYYSTDYIAVYDDGNTVTVDFVEHFRRPVRLSMTEFSALQAALLEIENIDSENNEILDNLRKKLASATVKPDDKNDIQNIIKIGITSQNLKTRLGIIKHAISQRTKIELEYFSINNKKIITRIVQPYMILRVKNSLYLRAFCTLRKDYRLFKTERIKSIKLTNENFQPLSELELIKLSRKPVTYVAPRKLSSIGSFKIQFSQKVAKYIEEDWSQKYWKKQKNGEVMFEAPIIDEDWVLRYVFSFGQDAKLLEPENLRQKFINFCKNVSQNCFK